MWKVYSGLSHEDYDFEALKLWRETIIKQVNQRARQSAIVLIILLLLIALMIWVLIRFGNYLYSLVASIF